MHLSAWRPYLFLTLKSFDHRRLKTRLCSSLSSVLLLCLCILIQKSLKLTLVSKLTTPSAVLWNFLANMERPYQRVARTAYSSLCSAGLVVLDKWRCVACFVQREFYALWVKESIHSTSCGWNKVGDHVISLTTVGIIGFLRFLPLNVMRVTQTWSHDLLVVNKLW